MTRKKKDRQQSLAERRDDALKRLMIDAGQKGDFRLVLRWILEETGEGMDFDVEARGEPMQRALGRMGFGVWLRNTVEELSPAAYLRSLSEGQEERGLLHVAGAPAKGRDKKADLPNELEENEDGAAEDG